MMLAESVLDGDRLALARLLTHVENNTPDGRAALQALFPRTGQAHQIGVTGAPGTGKSSLVNRLAMHYRGKGQRVAIAAVDPSSPVTGGALLGDRVRMKDVSCDAGVFIRSMASRGTPGGLARTTAGIVQVFDAAGFEIILIETVGTGQGEVEIARQAHTTLVVEAPGLGDDIQAIKAGMLEIADILVVNKADRPGVENTEKALRLALDLGGPPSPMATNHRKTWDAHLGNDLDEDGWSIPIQKTISTDGHGIPELAKQIDQHLKYLHASSQWMRREEVRLVAEVDAMLQQTLVFQFRAILPKQRYNEVMQQVFQKKLSPDEAVSIFIAGARQVQGERRGGHSSK
jgi:LAO/AO transport system kinase